jgi:glutamyl-Q tRNA(Asp) synthetase
MTVVTRFAPSPTGLLHLGHAHAALFAWRAAEAARGRCLLRIEDIDRGRCRSEFEAAIEEDLAWLDLHWEGPVRRQSEHLGTYAEIARAAEAPHGPDGPLYPGTCRELGEAERQARLAAGEPHALRLDVARAAAEAGPLVWVDRGRGKVAAEPAVFGDVVLARKDTPTSYHLAVTLDDALQGVTLVTRGEDLFPATHIHRLLQALLDLPVPEWHHHGLLTDAAGKRLAKRHDPLTIRALRDAGRSPAEVRALAGFPDEGP